MNTSGLEFSFDIISLLIILLCVVIGFVVLSAITSVILKKPLTYPLKKTWDLALCVFIFLGIIQCLLPASIVKWISLIVTGALGVIAMLDWSRRKHKRQKNHKKESKKQEKSK